DAAEQPAEESADQVESDQDESDQDESDQDESDQDESSDDQDEASAAAAADGDEDDGTVRLADSLPIDVDDDLSEVEGDASARLMSIVESLMFASSKPLSVKQLRKWLKEPSKRQIQLALKRLIEVSADRGVVVAQVAGGFKLRT